MFGAFASQNPKDFGGVLLFVAHLQIESDRAMITVGRTDMAPDVKICVGRIWEESGDAWCGVVVPTLVYPRIVLQTRRNHQIGKLVKGFHSSSLYYLIKVYDALR